MKKNRRRQQSASRKSEQAAGGKPASSRMKVIKLSRLPSAHESKRGRQSNTKKQAQTASRTQKVRAGGGQQARILHRMKAIKLSGQQSAHES
jgi:hypothetical protein